MNRVIQLTGYDFVIIALLFLFTLRGFWVGFLRQITVLVALLVGYTIAGQYHDKLFPFLRGVTENPHAVFWTSYAILFAFTYVVTMLMGKGLARVVELTVAGWFDKILGGVLGFAKGGVLVILLNMVLTGILAPENPMIRNCQLYPYVKQATDLFRSLIKDEKIRDSFLQKEPAISSEKTTEPLPPEVSPFVPANSPKE
ncbi:MAG: CvpA family protein, partial [Bacteroidetes bacterium]|nr:CvpA family protein [Bacteroidota bacterium]